MSSNEGIIQEAMKARMKQTLVDYLVSIPIKVVDPQFTLTIKFTQEEGDVIADRVIELVAPEIDSLVAAAERAGRQKETREEWLRPLITPEEGDDGDRK